MKEIFVLVYSSVSLEDDDLYSEIIGLYSTEQKAREAMIKDIENDGETIDEWKIGTTTARFEDFYYKKGYKIESYNVDI